MNQKQVIHRVDVHALDIPLNAPFTTASSNLEIARNLAIQVTLSNGTVGWGETPILHPITVEDRETALSALRSEAAQIIGQTPGAWRRLADGLLERIPDLASVRAGIEMATLDALTRSWGAPLYQFFGGCAASIVTDITIPICGIDEAKRLAERYRHAGFETLKIKIGLDTDDDLRRLIAIREGHPAGRLILDANAGYTVAETLFVLRELRRAEVVPALLEQPVPRDDWEGMGQLAREAGVPIAADESCRTPEDVLRIARRGLAQVVNIKLAKSGVARALEMVAIARAAGLGLMVGGMVESRIAMGFSVHFAAGAGGFSWVDLDTPLLLSADPVIGGYRADGGRYVLDVGTAGHGGDLRSNETP